MVASGDSLYTHRSGVPSFTSLQCHRDRSGVCFLEARVDELKSSTSPQLSQTPQWSLRPDSLVNTKPVLPHRERVKDSRLPSTLQTHSPPLLRRLPPPFLPTQLPPPNIIHTHTHIVRENLPRSSLRINPPSSFKMSQTNGYGTVVRHSAPATTNHVDDEEHQPLLNGGPRPKSLVTRVRKAAKAQVKRDWADVVLIFCYIITGLLDSASISIWGSFVSMQTGKPCFSSLFWFMPSLFDFNLSPSSQWTFTLFPPSPTP